MEKSSSDSESSPEFEFWNMVDNPPSFPRPTDLLTADQLFADGILLPLRPIANIAEPIAEPIADSSPIPPPPPPPPPPNKWKSIFKTNTKKSTTTTTTCNNDGKERKKASATANSVGSAAELNIHIWPFSRSHSAGNARPKASASVPLRKSSSAPGSRSNASGGIHVGGRTAPVWRLRRKNNGSGGGVGEEISVDVQQQSCREDGGNGRRMFNNLRTIFSTKKVY